MSGTIAPRRIRTVLVSVVILVSATAVGATAMPVGAQSGDSGEIRIEVVGGTVAGGEEITIEATLDDVPVANGSVVIDTDTRNGTFETTTDADGRATLTVPDADSVRLVVFAEDRDVFGERQLIGDDDPRADDAPEEDDSGDIQIEVVEGTVAAGQEITIEAVLDGTPVANATVFVESDTQLVESTPDANGRATITVPDADFATVTVEAEDTNAFGRERLLVPPEEPPDGETPPEDERGQTGAIEIDVVDDSVSRGEELTIRATSFNEPLVNASVRVRTDSGELPLETRTDSDGRATFTVPETEFVAVTVADSTGDAVGTKQLFGKPDDTPSGETGFNASVIDTSITHVAGPAPDEMPTVDAFVSADMLQVQLKRAPNTGIDGRDLAALGVTPDTKFEVTVTTTSFEPRLMIGAGNDVSWDHSVDDGSTEITITTKPASQQLIFPDDGQPPRLGNWPEGEADRATTDWEVAADFAIDSLSGPGQRKLQGGYITTDAQAFSSPIYSPPRGSQSPELRVDIAGPHFTVDGTENDGFYRAKLPDSLLSSWNVSDASALSAAYKGSEKEFDTTTVADGLVIELDVEYSSGTVQIGTELNDSAPANDTGDNTTTGPAEPADGLTSFTGTSRPDEVTPNSLRGKIRAEAAVAADVEVELLRDTATNYSLAITAPNGTENVTFYLQSRAVKSSQKIDNLTMYIDNERQAFHVDESAGPGQSPWLGFRIDEFSTRTVTVTSESSTDDDTSAGFLSVASTAATVTPGENVTVTYTVENTESQPTAYTLALETLPENLTVSGFSGDVRSTSVGGARPTASTTSLAAGATGTVRVTYQVGADAAGPSTVEVSVENTLAGKRDTATTTLTVSEAPTDPRQRVLQIAGAERIQELTQTDVTKAITLFNRGQSRNGVTLTQNDVSSTITLFNRAR
jgi:hypothetical protein